MATLQDVRGHDTEELERLASPPTQIPLGFTTVEEATALEPPHPSTLPSQLNRSTTVLEITALEGTIPTSTQLDESTTTKIITGVKTSPSPAPLQLNGSATFSRPKNTFAAIVRTVRFQYYWENPQDSIGTSCGVLGNEKLKCWEAKGPALELTRDLVPEILKHLNCCKEDVYGGKSVRRLLGFGIYMVGKSEADARPFLIISGDRDPRRKAMKLIQESKVLDQFRDRGGVAIRELSKPPISDGPVTLVADYTTQALDSVAEGSRVVFYDASSEVRNGFGIQVYTLKRDANGSIYRQKATIGCILWFREKYLGWTAAHAFSDVLLSSYGGSSNDEESDTEFAFDDETEDISIEPVKGVSVNTHNERVSDHSFVGVVGNGGPGAPEPTAVTESTDEALELEVFGSIFTSCSSVGHDKQGLDWALIEITNPKFKTASTVEAVNGLEQLAIGDGRPFQADVFAATGSGGVRKGELSPMPTYMMLHPSTMFQEVWTVRFEKAGKPLAKGDCGSLVIDSKGNILGHLVAGDVENGVGYIIPAAQAFEGMKRRVGDGLSLSPPPSDDSILPLASPSRTSTLSQGQSASSDDTQSLHSTRSLLDGDVIYIFIHGRRYCQDYYMPNDEDEQDRLNVLHQIYLSHTGLTTVPLLNPRKILDIGTGTGEWAIDMGEEYPDAEIIGSDIANIQPSMVPLNVFFEIDDAEEGGGWTWPENEFDLVHFRSMIGAFQDWKHIYTEAYKHLKPGGWIEVIDFDESRLLSHFGEKSVVRKWLTAIDKVTERTGRHRSIQYMEPDALSRLGFIDVKSTSYDFAIGSWPLERGKRRDAQQNLVALLSSVEAMCLRPLTELDWNQQKIEKICGRVADELRSLALDPEKGKGLCLELKVLVARKPDAPEMGEA